MKSEIIEHAKVLEKKYKDKKIDYKQIIDAYELIKAKGFLTTIQIVIGEINNFKKCYNLKEMLC